MFSFSRFTLPNIKSLSFENPCSKCILGTSIFWNFDGTFQDLYNNFNGVGQNGPTFASPGYNGAGSCLLLNGSAQQSITVNSPPFLNMTYTSFTFEVWAYANTLYDSNPKGDSAIFGQSQQTTADLSMHINIRFRRIFFGFFLDDLTGSQVINTGQWYHLAYVYDYAVGKQFVYVNGYLDASRASSSPYLGNSGALTIGTNAINAGANFFDGCLDSLSYVSRAKNATEILNDATNVVSLSFDNNNLLDGGPLMINATGMNYSFTPSGRINQCLTLSGALSYVQIPGLRRLGTNGWPYTFALWIYPKAVSGGTIIHLTNITSGPNAGQGWCVPMIGFTSTGLIAINSWNNLVVRINGPNVPLLSWTHIAATYSPTNGARLYVNGSQYGTGSGAFTFSAGGVPMMVVLGSSLNGTEYCESGTITKGQYQGSFDEFRIYARELNASEIAALSNP